jgi:hypothetical protein
MTFILEISEYRKTIFLPFNKKLKELKNIHYPH